MKIGDLVKVYHFSHTARRKFAATYGSDSKWAPERIDAHYVGLIVASSDPDSKHRRVLRCVDGDEEVYHVNRLEVIA